MKRWTMASRRSAQGSAFIRTATLSCGVLAAAALAPAAQAQALEGLDVIRWESASGGQVPRGAPQMGRNTDGGPLYVCAATVDGKQYPGKLSPAHKRCFVAVKGREMALNFYEVPVTGPDGRQHWARESDRGFEWRRALSVNNLHFCSAPYQGSFQLGSRAAHEKRCRFGYGGKEIAADNYQVLMSR